MSIECWVARVNQTEKAVQKSEIKNEKMGARPDPLQ